MTMNKSVRTSVCLFAMLAGGLSPFAGRTQGMEPHPIPAVDAARLKTRVVCSCLFVQEMSPARCLNGEDEIFRYPFPGVPKIPEKPAQHLVTSVDTAGATVQFFDDGKLLAQSRYLDDGGGCVTGEPGRKLPAVTAEEIPAKPLAVPEPLPRGTLEPDVNESALAESLDAGFSADGPLAGFTRAVLIVHEGKVVEERYAPGFGPHHRYYLGSVAKVFNNLLAGLLVRDGRLRVDEPVALPQWRQAGDPRGSITFDQMLHMTSGLEWDEQFFVPGAPAYDVYFAGPASLDVAEYAASRGTEAEPGTHYEYSTGASNLLGYALQQRMEEQGRAATLRYLRRELLQPIGALGIVVEFDAAGTLLTGQSIYARPMDLARVGLLLMQDGRWRDERVLPAGWVEYSTSLDLAKDEGSPYGAQLMLNHVVPGCFGHTGVGGQKLIVCPERELVVVWFSSDFNFFGERAVKYDGLLEVQQRMIRAFPSTGH